MPASITLPPLSLPRPPRLSASLCLFFRKSTRGRIRRGPCWRRSRQRRRCVASYHLPASTRFQSPSAHQARLLQARPSQTRCCLRSPMLAPTFATTPFMCVPPPSCTCCPTNAHLDSTERGEGADRALVMLVRYLENGTQFAC